MRGAKGDGPKDGRGVRVSDPDVFSKTTRKGWGARVGRSIIGLIVGLLMVPAAIVLLCWNEGRAVEASSALDRSLRQVVEVSPDRVLPDNGGKLVHLVGEIVTSTPARDPAFDVGGEDLLRLRRTVEMYQWKEDENSTAQQSSGGSEVTQTTYTYHRVWSEEPIDSGAFRHPQGHVNLVMPMTSTTFDAQTATLGAYRVDPGVLDQISQFAPFAATKAPQTPAPPSPFYPARSYHVEDGGFYLGQNSSNPAIGDLRISFSAVAEQVFSVAAAQAGTTLTPYHAADGYEIALIRPGSYDATALFAEKKPEERLLTWIFRGLGFFFMFLAFALLAAPLVTLFAVVPFLEGIAGAGALLVALTLSVPVTLATIGIAWAAHRPLVGGALLAAALISFVLLTRLHRPKAPRAAAAS